MGPSFYRSLGLVVCAILAIAEPTIAAPQVCTFNPPLSALNSTVIDMVRANLRQSAGHSWEYGTRAEAITELDYRVYSVFSRRPFPLPTRPVPTEINNIATFVLQQRPRGILPLFDDGSSGDPNSMGVALLVANWTQASSGGTEYTFGGAAADQLKYTLEIAPRTSDGAISHRASEPQIWADFVYMVPPFIAYHGAVTGDKSLILEAYNQVRLYRKYLRDPNGLWKHIVLGSSSSPSQDFGHWSTGNAWAAAGMARVLATARGSQFAGELGPQIVDLAGWINEILEAAWSFQQPNMLLRNYIDDDSSFGEACGTTLLAATTYRMAQYRLLGPNSSHLLLKADQARKAIYENNIDSQGWLYPVVNPLDWSQEGSHSPEGQAFVLMMEAGFRDYKASCRYARRSGMTKSPSRLLKRDSDNKSPTFEGRLHRVDFLRSRSS